ncbi:transglutaminase domain-containing protein [Candidatus Dependentiae bacterium]|nr:transglutaminase domain-containing protein [Candidatus Dependentiae bacterium]
MRTVKSKIELWNTKDLPGTVILALPPNTRSQTVKELRFISGKPDRVVQDIYSLNTIAQWQKTSRVDVEWEIELYTVYLSDLINSSQRGHRLPDSLQQLYTREERFLEQHDKIRAAAHQITAGYKSDLDKAKAIFQWQVDNMKQQGRIIGGPGAMNALIHMDGNCGSFVWLFVSLCRCLNIPARVIMGGLAIEKQAGFHAWAEVFISSLGWISIDSSIAQSLKDESDWFVERGFPGDSEFYFGGICDRNIIFSEGMNINLKNAGLNIPAGLEVVDFLQPGADIYFGLQGDTRRKKIAGWSGMFYKGDTQLDEDEIRREMQYSLLK